MLRTGIRDCSRSLLAQSRCNVRCQSTSGGASAGKGSGGLGKVAVIVTGATAGLLGAGTALAKFDPAFRKSIEDSIPLSDKALNAIIGPAELSSAAAVSKKLPVVPTSSLPSSSSSPSRSESVPASLLQKKLDRESVSSKTTAVLPAVPSPVLDQPVISSTTSPKTPVAGSSNKSDRPVSADASKSAPAPVTTTTINKNSGLAPTLIRRDDPSSGKESSSLPATATIASSSQESVMDSLTQGQREKLKQEMTEQLKLQLSAYNDYLQDQLRLQADELSRMHSIDTEERVLEEKMRYQRELVNSIVRLQDVEQVLKVRERLDKEERELKQVWFLCQQLNDSLKSSPLNGTEQEPLSLLTQSVIPVLEAIMAKADTSPLVKLAVSSIKDQKDLRERGIYTEDALISRFEKVSKICQRVSLVGDNGGSLFRFLLSAVMPSLLFDTVWSIPRDELDDIAVNTGKLDTFSIVHRVRHHLRHRNLEMALRYANQLRGEPRKAAGDWIRDVRTHLEVRQASTLIQAQAAAVSLSTFQS